MAKIDDYWILLPEHDELIHTELQSFAPNKSVERFSSLEITKRAFDFLCRCLRTVRLPTSKILQLLPKSIADGIYHSVLLDLLHDINADNSNQLLAILLNGQFSAELITRFESEFYPKLVNVLATNNDIDRHFKLCLAFVDNDKFRDRYLFITDRLCDGDVGGDDLLDRRRLFALTVVKRKHFLEKLIHCDNGTCFVLSNDVLRKILFLMKMLRNADQPIKDNQQQQQQQQFVQEIKKFITSSTNNCLRRNLFNEMQRLLHLKELSSFHIPHIQLMSYAPKFNTIDYLYERVNLSSVDSESVLALLDENRKYNQRFDFRRCCTGMASELTELELYKQFLVVKLLLEVIMDNQQSNALNESSVDKLNKVKMLFNQFKSIPALTNILEITFSLIFLRWDNLTDEGDSMDSDRIVDESGSERSIKSRKCSNRSERTAFLCSAVVLDNIFDLLKMGVSLEPYQSNVLSTTDEKERNAFLRLRNNVNDAHWRVRLSSANSAIVTGSRSALSVSDDIRQYLTRHKLQAREKSNGSSDNDDNDGSGSQQNASIHRRKPRKKNPMRKSTDDKNLIISNSTEHEQRSDAMIYRSVSGFERRCPVSRLFGSAEHLAIVCLNNGHFEATREIVEANNLQNSIPARELQFMENYSKTKQKLRSIFDKYNTHAGPSVLNTGSTVERLKHVATIGFEASQTQTIITSFADENAFHTITTTTEATRNLVRKLHRQYPFLEMYNGKTLPASIASDLIISLTNSYEMCFNIFNMLTKLWATDTNCFDDDANVSFGYLKFIRNVCDCLQLCKSIGNDNFGLRELICNECYTLKPFDLKAKLEKERAMKSVQCRDSNDLVTMEQWKTLLKPIWSGGGDDVNYFHRMYHFVLNSMKLLKIQSPNLKTPPATPLDVMQGIDLRALIGEIVFVNGKSPSDIVEIVENLNVNFVYILGLNMMPVIPCLEPNDRAVTDSLIENLRNDNLVNVKPSSVEKNSFYPLTSDVLNFIQRNNHLVAYLHQEQNTCSADAAVTPTLIYEQNYLKNAMALLDVKTVAMIHGDNLLVSALSYDTFDVTKMEEYLRSGGSYRNAIQIIQSIGERSLKLKDDRLTTLKDILITKLLNECNSNDNNNCDLIELIADVNVKSKHLLENVLAIESSDMVKRLIRSTLLHKNVSILKETYKEQLHEWLLNIQIYDTVTDRMCRAHWGETRALSINSSETILKRLMDVGEFDLCLAWLKMHPLGEGPRNFAAFSTIFREIILATTSLNRMMFKIVETLPLNIVLQFYDNLLTELRCLELLQYITDFLIANSLQPSIYERYRISLKIFSQMNEEEQDTNWLLFNTPLMIIEQYLMNSRHETLSAILKSIKPILNSESCKYCFANRTNSTYDAKSKSDPDFKISLSENDFGYADHSLNQHCINSLLKIYASKALDFRVSETHHSHSSNELLTHSMASLDSLCGSFVMPKVAPDRLHWVKDEDAAHCMCCRRSAFTMLCRRHHCRRCGRVVCHACSTKRIEIPELYCDVQVRSCDDCYKQMQCINQRKSSNVALTAGGVNGNRAVEIAVWQFSGNKKHDVLLREEFCFEYAPSVSLCLSILQFHSSDGDCVNFLLHHCQKFESLLRPMQPGFPNPEIDYALVTRMMHCLALAAKVRGGPPECDTIRDHGEIIQSIVQHGCESLMPLEPPNSSSFRTLRDSLVLAEKWSLALELSLKCGFATTGVLAAWGIACLRAGCFDTAREKFSHCLTKTGTDSETLHLTSLLLQDNTSDEWNNTTKIKRPVKSPPLLGEIVSILEITCHSHQPEVIARASVIKDSNTSLASNMSKKREKVPLHEPALNVMHTLSSLKSITRGIYDVRNVVANKKVEFASTNNRKLIRCSRFYDECLYYLTRYGSHTSILNFLIEYDQLATALKYVQHQNVNADTFINVIFLPFLKAGKVEIIINLLMAMDGTLLLWKELIIRTCCYLEHRGLLNSLYHLQILLKDPVRASMTCVKFYSMNCSTYQELQNNSFHLHNAQKHLQTELELCQWEEIPSVHANTNTTNRTNEDVQSILMKMDSRTLNSHINTIWRQIEVTKFLSKCEQDGCDMVALLTKITAEFSRIPTLFGTLQEKIQLAVLTIIAGSNINAGFGLAFRIIQDFNLSPIKVYGITAKYLSGHNRLGDVEKLVENIKSNSDSNSDAAVCDEIISLAIHTAVAAAPLNVPIKQLIGQTIESLLRQVTDVGIKISCHIAGGQLKSAYLLAVQYERFNDVKKVLRKAEQTNQLQIKKLCEKKLNAH